MTNTVASRRWAGRLWVGQSAAQRPPPLSERPFALNASPQQEERPIRQILYLGDLLETCHFQAFWVTCLGPRGRVVTGPCRKSCWKSRPCTFIGFFRGSGPCVQSSACGMAQMVILTWSWDTLVPSSADKVQTFSLTLSHTYRHLVFQKSPLSFKYSAPTGLPWCPVFKILCFHCSGTRTRHGFKPWLGN